MAQDKRKRKYVVYILPILFCALLIVLAVIQGRESASPVKAVLQAGEPLAMTDQAIENYLYAAGYTLKGDAVLDAEGTTTATLTVTKPEDGSIEAMTLTFSLPAYYEAEEDGNALDALKAIRDAATERGEELFLSLFDAVAATDKRVTARRDSALEKLRKTMSTGKASVQNANSWRFSFSLEQDLLKGTVTILFEKVK